MSDPGQMCHPNRSWSVASNGGGGAAITFIVEIASSAQAPVPAGSAAMAVIAVRWHPSVGCRSSPAPLDGWESLVPRPATPEKAITL